MNIPLLTALALAGGVAPALPADGQASAAKQAVLGRVGVLGLPAGTAMLLDCPPFAAPRTAARMLIPAGFLTATDDRNVRVTSNEAANKGKDDFEIYDATSFDAGDKSATAEFNTNPFHLDLDTPKLHASADAYIKVRVVLEGRKFEFSPEVDGVVAPLAAVNDLLFCQIRSDPTEKPVQRSVKSGGGGKRSLLTFYVQNGTKVWDSFVNFVIVARKKTEPSDPATGGGFKTPILIDPRVKNDG